MKYYVLKAYLLLLARQLGEHVHMTAEVMMYTGAHYPEIVDLTLAQGCEFCEGTGYRLTNPDPDIVAAGGDYAAAMHCSACQPMWPSRQTPCPFLPADHDVCDNPECRMAVPHTEDHCPSCDTYQLQF